jgi:hypothetical protein
MLPHHFVIAGLVPAIHVFLPMGRPGRPLFAVGPIGFNRRAIERVVRNKSGHDGVGMAYSLQLIAYSFLS